MQFGKMRMIKMNFIKILYWRLFNRKNYENYVRFNHIIKYGNCHKNAPVAYLNFSYHYFCMYLIDKGWKKENVTIQNNNTDGFNEFSSEIVRTE